MLAKQKMYTARKKHILGARVHIKQTTRATTQTPL